MPSLAPASEDALTLTSPGSEDALTLAPSPEDSGLAVAALTELQYSVVGAPGLYPSAWPSAATFPSPGGQVVNPGPRLTTPTAGSLALTPALED